MLKRLFSGKRSRFVSLLLLSGLLLSACSLPVTAPAEPEPEPVYQGNLTLWAAPDLAGYPVGLPDGWFAERARAYEALHPGVTVRVEMAESAAKLEAALAAPAGQAVPGPGPDSPDLVFGRFLPALAPRLAPLDSLLPSGVQGDYPPGALAAFRQGDALLGLPVLLEVQVLALNQAAFEAAGATLPPNGAWTQAEFAAALQKLSGNGHFGLGFYQLPRYHEYWPLLSGLITPDGQVAAGAAAGLQRLQDFRTNGWIHPDSGKVKAEEIWSLFAAGDFAVMPVPAWAVPQLRQEPYNIKLSVAGFPDGLTTGYTYGFQLLQQEDSLKLKAALELAQFMAAPDQQVRLSRATALMPARTSTGNPFDGDGAMTAAYQTAAGQQPLPAGPWETVESEFHKPLLYALLGSMAPQDAVDAIQKAIAPASR